jgi:hypothetical protein
MAFMAFFETAKEAGKGEKEKGKTTGCNGAVE